GELTSAEQDRLLDLAAYRKLAADWGGKESEDALAVVNWLADSLRTDMGKIAQVISGAYGRGSVSALDHAQMAVSMAGELPAILAPLIGRVLDSVYESQEIRFDPPFVFKREDAVKVINGIVRTGEIPRGAKPTQEISAAQNFGFALG